MDEAIEALERAVGFGYGDFGYIQRDPDLANVRSDPRFVSLMEGVLRKRPKS